MKNTINLTQSLNQINQQLIQKKQQSNLGSELKSLLVEMAVGVAKSESENEGFLNNIKDVEKLYIRCNQLLSLLHIAHSENEITKSTFLSFEIQVQSLLHRLLRVSQKINTQTL